MVVRHYSTEVDVLGGDVDEGWAIVAFPTEDTGERVVPISELNADDALEEIIEHIEKRADYMGQDLSIHLPLQVRLNKDRVRILTNNGEYLLDRDMHQVARDAEDRWEVGDTASDTIYWLNMAHEQPKKFVMKKIESFDEDSGRVKFKEVDQ